MLSSCVIKAYSNSKGSAVTGGVAAGNFGLGGLLPDGKGALLLVADGGFEVSDGSDGNGVAESAFAALSLFERLGLEAAVDEDSIEEASRAGEITVLLRPERPGVCTFADCTPMR